MTQHRRFIFGTVGVATVTLGIALFLAPGLATVGPLAGVIEALDALGTTNLLLVTGVGLIGYLAVGLRSPTNPDDTSPFDSPATTPEASATEIAGGEFDELVQSAVADGGESLLRVESRLRQTAAAVYADRMDCSLREARAAIERGEWCADPLAAAVLSEQHAVPFGAQVRLFVLPNRERRRRIERSLAAIERLEAA